MVKNIGNKLTTEFTPKQIVGSVQNALLPFGSRFSRTCPQTVLACLHAYGSPLIT